jgi:hypothetical protein
VGWGEVEGWVGGEVRRVAREWVGLGRGGEAEAGGEGEAEGEG